jgi:hypothetical protein
MGYPRKPGFWGTAMAVLMADPKGSDSTNTGRS